MRNNAMASVVLAAALVSAGMASAQPHRQRARSAAAYMSSDSVRGPELAPRGFERGPQTQSLFGFGNPTGGYYSSHPGGGGGNGSP